MNNLRLLQILITSVLCFAVSDNSHALSPPKETPPSSLNEEAEIPISQLKKSIIRIYTLVKGETEQDSGLSCGTGFVVRGDGVIATNRHVIENAMHVWVFISSPDGSHAVSHEAKVVKIHENLDLALLQIEGYINYLPTPLKLSETKAEVLDEVLAIGYPAILDTAIDYKEFLQRRVIRDPEALNNLDPNVTIGTISKLVPNRSIILHDAQIDKGNSGGPLISKKTGEILGINTFVGANRETLKTYNMSIVASALATLLEDYNIQTNYKEKKEDKKVVDNQKIDKITDTKKSTVVDQQEDTTKKDDKVKRASEEFVQPSVNYNSYGGGVVLTKKEENDNTLMMIVSLIAISLTIIIIILIIYKTLRKRNTSRILCVTAVSNNTQSQTYNEAIEFEKLLYIGRSSECHICLQEPKASRKHASIRMSERGLSIRDEGSTNGIICNGKKLPSGNFYRIDTDKTYTIGDTSLRFSLK